MVQTWGTPRRGISLVEILMSIGVASIGLLGVASLIPVAQHAATQGTKADRAAWIGRRALAEFQIRGMDNPLNWIYLRPNGKTGDASIAGELPGPAVSLTGPQLANLVSGPRFGPNSYPLDAVLLDPMGVGYYGTSGNQTREFASTCPADANSKYPVTNRLRRASLRAGAAGAAYSRVMPYLQARSIFEMQDDLAFTVPSNDNGAPPVPQFWAADNSGQSAVITTPSNLVKKRYAEGRFSWIATVVPERGSDQYILSVVVLYDRELNLENAPAGGLRSTDERWAVVSSPTNVTPPQVVWAGGLNLQADPRDPVALDGLKAGQWILLVEPYLRANTTKNDSPLFLQTYARWYRVTQANHVEGSATGEYTVDGPDWPLSQTGANATAIIFKNAIDVYEKVIRLNADGTWIDVGQFWAQ